MRTRADAERINAFIRELGRAARAPARLHLTGGATAVLEGWRATTVGIDIHLLSKLERAFDHDLEDVRSMIARGLVDAVQARELFGRIEPELYRFPAIDPASFRARVERELG